MRHRGKAFSVAAATPSGILLQTTACFENGDLVSRAYLGEARWRHALADAGFLLAKRSDFEPRSFVDFVFSKRRRHLRP